MNNDNGVENNIIKLKVKAPEEEEEEAIACRNCGAMEWQIIKSGVECSYCAQLIDKEEITEEWEDW